MLLPGNQLDADAMRAALTFIAKSGAAGRKAGRKIFIPRDVDNFISSRDSLDRQMASADTVEA